MSLMGSREHAISPKAHGSDQGQHVSDDAYSTPFKAPIQNESHPRNETAAPITFGALNGSAPKPAAKSIPHTGALL
jgi:hypothetical protein